MAAIRRTETSRSSCAPTGWIVCVSSVAHAGMRNEQVFLGRSDCGTVIVSQQGVDDAVAAKRRLAGQQHVQDGSDRIDIRRRSNFPMLGFGLFG